MPTTIGEHVKRVRSERKLRQVDVAREIGVSAATVLHWEAGHTEPPVAFMPAIVRFLGYEPWPEATTFGERMRVHRYRHGLSINEAARRAGVDEGSWAKWEATGCFWSPRHRRLVEKIIADYKSVANS